MTVAEVRQWLRNWIANAVGQSPDSIDEATPMVELGLASRDAVAMAADIEDRTGVTVSIAAAFEHPTIESLATWIVEGDPEIDDSADDTDWTRSGPVERVDIAV
ncbi:MAG TPA: acyl carrier protein, partial [Mycobacterium sp.]